MTALKNFLDIHEFNTYCMRILETRAQFFPESLRLDTTNIQYLSVAMIMRPRFLKTAMLDSEWPYTLNTVSVPTRAYSAARMHCFFYDTLIH